MNTKAAKNILKKIAMKNGISEEEVRMEIKKAIELAASNKDPKIHNKFNEIKCKGDIPTPEEVLVYLSNQCGR